MKLLSLLWPSARSTARLPANVRPLHMLSKPFSKSRPLTPPPETPAENPSKRRRIHYPAMTSPPTITLTPEEEKIRKVLVDVAADIDATSGDTATAQPLTLRFTGGWVRDKLLGQQSHDIDVGIDRMTGFDFASHLSRFLTEHMDDYNIPARSIYKIESNPEKSKHLETATTKIYDLDIDLVNLRSETYSADSRIPQMQFGTPVEDALRRDACVNALFYNLHTQQVEDFTERGLQDMEDRVMRTPLPPFETFKDDPLRVLRLIRFASRLEFTIVPEALDAMQNPEIREQLRSKISRERVGVEVDKMLQGPHPYLALSLLYQLDLFSSLFTPPANQPLPENLPVEHMARATRLLSYLLENLETPDYQNLLLLLKTPHKQYLGWLIASVTPFTGHMFDGYDTKKNIPAAASVSKEGLKAPNKVFDVLVNSYRNYEQIQDIVAQMTQDVGQVSRGKLGLFLRKLGAEWTSPVLCSLLLEALKAPVWEEEKEIPAEVSQVLSKYGNFLARIKELDLMEAYTFKPILTGKDLKNVLEEKKAGPWLAGALNYVMEWQMNNPDKDKEAAEVWAKSEKEKLISSET